MRAGRLSQQGVSQFLGTRPLYHIRGMNAIDQLIEPLWCAVQVLGHWRRAGSRGAKIITFEAIESAKGQIASWLLIAFGLATLITMLAVVLASVYGLSKIPVHNLERYSHALAGPAILLCGGAIRFLGLPREPSRLCPVGAQVWCSDTAGVLG
jgi:hypothetical protein